MAYSCQTQRTKAYDDDIRWRMVYQRCAMELSYCEIAANLNVDPSTVQRIVLRFEETGTVSSELYPRGHEHPHQKLSKIDELLILHLVIDRPSIYLREIQQEIQGTTGTVISLATICNFLHKNGFTRQKLSKIAIQRSNTEREQFRRDISIYKPEMFVFIDETGADKRDALRKFGYGLRGKQPRALKLLARGKHVTAIGAICSEGMLDCKIVEGSVTADTFQEYLDECLLPKLLPFNGVNSKSIVVMDNATIHHVDKIVDTLESLRVLILFLPAYSPDMNPIEEAFAKVKSIMKDNEVLLDAGMDIETLVLMGFSAITKEDCIGWMKNAGYY